MRILFNKPPANEISEELLIVQEVFTSIAFVYLDLAVLSFFITLLLTPILQTFSYSILFFIVLYANLVGCYCLFKKWLPD